MQPRIRNAGLATLLVSISVLSSAGMAQPAEKSVAPIYPVAHAIQIDGDITDWEWAPSLGTEKFAWPITVAEYGVVARFWARYDEQFLYVAFRINDSSPAMNKKVGTSRWEGDQVELLLCTDPKGHAQHHAFGDYDYQLLIGPDRAGKVDVFVNMNASKNNYGLPGGAAALKRWPDGKGYDLEAKIPWASLKRPDYFKPEAGLEIGWQIQIDFSTPDGERLAYAAKWYPFGLHFQDPSGWGWARFLKGDESLFAEEPVKQEERKPAGKAEITFTLPVSGLVSVNVTREDGVLIRRAVIGKKMEKGPHTVGWDGLDEEDQPVEAGDYRFTGLVGDVGVKYLATVGNTSPEPYGGCNKSAGGEYRHGEWLDVIGNPDGSFYVLNHGGEGCPNLQLIDPSRDFRVAWAGGTAVVGNDFQQFGARDDQYLYFVHLYSLGQERRDTIYYTRGGQMLSRMDAKTHQSKPFGNGQWAVRVTEPTEFESWNEQQYEVHGLGAHQGKVFVPFFKANRVDVYDGEKGEKIASFSDPQMNGPSDVWATEEGVLYVVDKQAVHKFSLDGKHLGVPVRGLEQGWSVAVDGKGRIYVSDIATHAVKIFDPQGKLLRALGNPSSVRKGSFYTVREGWKWLEHKEVFEGKVGDDTFFRPEGIAVDAQGNLIVTDHALGMVQCYDSSFRLRKSLVSEVYANLCVDPQKPETVFLMADSPPIARQYEMDWSTGKHRLVAQYAPVPTASCGTQYVKFRGDQPYFFTCYFRPVWTIENGRVRICSNLGCGWPTRSKVPVAEGGKVVDKDLTELPRWKSEPPGAWEWRDKNRDGLPQLDEYTFYSQAEKKPFWGIAYPHNYYVDDDWNVQGKVNEDADGRYLRIPFGGFDEAGNPIYSWSKAELAFEGSKVDPKWTADLSGGKPRQPSLGGIHAAKDGFVFLVLNDRPGFSPVDCRFRAYAPDGKRLFSICHTTKGFWDKPGEEISMCMQMPGTMDQFVFVPDVAGTVNVFTRAGLYAGPLLEGGDWAPEMMGKDERYHPYGECWYAHIFRHPKTKRVYLIAQPNGSPLVLLYEVTGLEAVQSFSGSCKLVPLTTTK